MYSYYFNSRLVFLTFLRLQIQTIVPEKEYPAENPLQLPATSEEAISVFTKETTISDTEKAEEPITQPGDSNRFPESLQTSHKLTSHTSSPSPAIADHSPLEPPLPDFEPISTFEPLPAQPPTPPALPDSHYTLREVPEAEPASGDTQAHTIPTPNEPQTEGKAENRNTPPPPFESANTSSNASSSDLTSDLNILVEAEPQYQVSVRRVSDASRRPRRESIEISLTTRPSTDSLLTVESVFEDSRTPSPVISETRERDSILFRDSDLPEIAEEEGSPVADTSKEDHIDKTYQSLFGGLTTTTTTTTTTARHRAESDPFITRDSTTTKLSQSPTKEPYQISRKPLDSPYHSPEKPVSRGDSTSIDTPTKQSVTRPSLSTIPERRSEDALRGSKISTEVQPPTPTRSKTFSGAAAKERKFISTEDLISRLAGQTIPELRKSRSSGSKPPLEEAMDILKRGERRRTISPTLRRVGSQIDSPRTSSEHIIFGGERYSTPDNKGKVRDITTAEYYEAWGDRDGEPKSPTRPPSIRRRQSLQIVDLETRLQSLAAENTNLTHEKANVEKSLAAAIQRQRTESAAFNVDIKTKELLLVEKDSEIATLHSQIEWYRQELSRLSQTNDKLKATNDSLSVSYKQSYTALTAKYDRKQEQMLKLSREHSELQRSFSELQSGMETIIRNELQEKDAELDRLRVELDKAREEVRKLQNKASARQSNKYIDNKDLNHFSSSCKSVYHSVKVWCSQFSSFSTGTKCIPLHKVKNELVRDRIDIVMLDDRGVRKMLKDEKRRPDVFMAIVMRMIWELVFTRYLFGLEVDERQKLLSIEKTLSEVGEFNSPHVTLVPE